MEGAAADERDEHDDVGVLEGVDPLKSCCILVRVPMIFFLKSNFDIWGSIVYLEVSGLVDGDVAVDRHADDDVNRRRHEGVEHGDLQVRLKCGLHNCF